MACRLWSINSVRNEVYQWMDTHYRLNENHHEEAKSVEKFQYGLILQDTSIPTSTFIPTINLIRTRQYELYPTSFDSKC